MFINMSFTIMHRSLIGSKLSHVKGPPLLLLINFLLELVFPHLGISPVLSVECAGRLLTTKLNNRKKILIEENKSCKTLRGTCSPWPKVFPAGFEALISPTRPHQTLALEMITGRSMSILAHYTTLSVQTFLTIKMNSLSYPFTDTCHQINDAFPPVLPSKLAHT